ncbi:cell division protein SepF [Konateibacter massiliensis]|uniref:cell division protein SepF n=1 Tax=Konateibacter massiliensis TaxID=2002841 RepID=UPI000C148EFA|nr:cell division protein SepF [Konateibacter massiliensis]
MGFMDKFLDVMRLNDEDDYEDDFYDDDYQEEKPKKKSITKNIDDDDDYEEESRFKPKAVKTNNAKVTPMRPSRKQVGSMEVCVIKPTSMEESREVTETLLTGRAVVLNLEGLDVDIAQRIIDFTSGSCFAISGNLQKISNFIFIITPSSVDISGDFQDLLSGAFDVPALHTEI